MYPNPQDALPLPPHPDVGYYRKRAKALVKACRSGDAAAMHAWSARWVNDLFGAQPESEKSRLRADVSRSIEQVAAFAGERLTHSDCQLAQAQFVIARAHGFESWRGLVEHFGQLSGHSPVSAFEEAADAIVEGNREGLEWLLDANPGLARVRSTREHRATLLHYVSANGVEGYRQKTPPNIVGIAQLLLDRGAEVDAGAEVYGGDASTLELVVTSAHPRAVGVQNELADLLLARGARVTPGIVRACLANGCPEAAGHMVRRGAPASLEDAAGIGRTDLLQRYLDDRGRFIASVSQQDLAAALLMAAWYDRRDVVGLLLDHGADPGVRLARKGEGQTALHVAAYQGHEALVALLIRGGTPVDLPDDTYGTPPLAWALHAWLVEGKGPHHRYRAVLRLLAEAGARVKPEWIDDDRLRADPELLDALRRRAE